MPDNDKHSGPTPGPWVLDGHNLSSVIHCMRERGHPEAKHVCGDYEIVARCEGENWLANARLIAAAPELRSYGYAADTCLSLAYGYARELGKYDEARHIGEVQQSLRAALKKADGA